MNTSTVAQDVPVMREPASGSAQYVANTTSYLHALGRLAAGTGPFAVDAERASGFRYGNRNYLIQIKREGSGIFLVDPTAFEDLSELNRVMQSDMWIFHAATQDIGPLAEQGLVPPRVFDTEFAARLLGLERVNLAAVTTHFLGVSLAKEFSHQDWSTRPLPEAWLNYAALDVELLVEVAREETELLREQGKLDWALEEFEHLRTLPTVPRTDP
ncbi:ribonuclease D, partial [Timonella senegalensis]